MTRALAVVAVALVLALGAQDTSAAGTPRGFTAEDLVRLDRLSDPQLSPDGTKVAYVVRTTDVEANRGRTDLWLLDLRTRDAAPVRLTSHEANDSSPRWSPDGTSIYFLSTRGGSSQVWRLPLGGGEAHAVTNLPVDVDNFELSPRGDRLAFSAGVFRDCADLGCTAKRSAEKAKDKATGRTYDALFVRHWDTWGNGGRNVLHSIALGADGRAAGAPVALSRSLDGDAPSKPFGGDDEYAFSPDGSRIAFAVRVAGREEAWSTNLDVYEVPAAGGAEPVNLTRDGPATDTQPAYSPDGRTLAWLSMSRPGFEADRYRILLRDLKTGAVRELAPQWDRSPHRIAWAPDSRSLYATADDLGQSPLFRIDVPTGRVTKLTAEGTVGEIVVARDALVYLQQSLGSPAELYALDGRTSRRLTRSNGDRLADVRFGAYEQYTFAGAGGATVHAYAMRPWNFEPGKKYPVAFIVHGGPQVSFGNNWSYRWNPQVYAGAGYAVVFVDFHGSPGYGQAFTDSISGDWGGKPLEDLKLGLAAAAQKFPWIDAGNACALGASYGGYMMNWIAGNWPDGFRCIVNHAGIFDTRSMGYMTEELWFTEWENGGPPWDPKADYEKWNPLNHVTKWRTPMLVLHGEKDYRVPYAQGIATFTTLQRRGIPSRLVTYPDENHWVLKPANSVQWHREVLGWLDAYLRR